MCAVLLSASVARELSTFLASPHEILPDASGAVKSLPSSPRVTSSSPPSVTTRRLFSSAAAALFVSGTLPPSNAMKALAVRRASVTHPTGDPKFSVLQAFPAAFTAEEADPFLMCDAFGPTRSKGIITDPDAFLVPWHPHRGQLVITYMVKGSVRHADSLGNRESFPAPGLQWIAVGSGIEHAEGGGTPAGELEQGFQIWVNSPSARKMDAPRYGTHGAAELPNVACGSGCSATLLAGNMGGAVGPLVAEGADILMADFALTAGGRVTHA